MTNVIELRTANELQYHFYPVTDEIVHFKVRANKDAHIALTTGPMESDPMIEIIIGGWNNTMSVIRKNRTKPDKVEVATRGIMSSGLFHGFWVRWHGTDRCVISVGQEGKRHFMTWTDPEPPFPIGFFGICTAWGATGVWQIEEPGMYELHEANSGALRFKVKLSTEMGNAVFSLTSKYNPSKDLYLVYFTTSSVLVKKNNDKESNPTLLQEPITGNEYKGFWLTWYSGAIRLGHEGQNTSIVEYVDDDLIERNIILCYLKVYPECAKSPVQWKFERSPLNLNPPKDVIFKDGQLRWVALPQNRSLPQNALIGGFEKEPLYIVKNGSEIPGKFIGSTLRGYYATNGREINMDGLIKVLVGYNAKWVQSRGYRPENAFVANADFDVDNYNHDNYHRLQEPRYIGRATYDDCLIIGEVRYERNSCYLPYYGKEIEVYYNFEILVTTDGDYRGIPPMSKKRIHKSRMPYQLLRLD